MLNIESLSVVYPDGTRAVDKLDLTAQDGESIALIGANGAGKTSLLLSLVGVLASEGTVCLDNMRLDKRTLRAFRAKVGMVFQNPDDQLFMPTVFDDVAFGLRNQGIAEDAVRQRVGHCLATLGIERLAERTALKLSGGEKRMAALATVLVMEPAALLLDEPTAFLDPRARRYLIHALRDLPQTKFIATHDLTFALETCERAALLKDGKIFTDGPARELLYDTALMEACGVEAVGVWEKGDAQ